MSDNNSLILGLDTKKLGIPCLNNKYCFCAADQSYFDYETQQTL